MALYNGKNVKATIGVMDGDDNLTGGKDKYLRGEISVDLDDRNMIVDDVLDGGDLPAPVALVQGKKRGKFSIKQLVLWDNFFPELIKNFANVGNATSFPISFTNDSIDEKVVLGINQGLSGNNVFMGRPNEFKLSVDAEEQFISYEFNGVLGEYDTIDDSEFSLAGLNLPQGKPFKANDARLQNSTGDDIADVRKIELTLKNGLEILENLGDPNFGAPAYEGEGVLTIALNPTTLNLFNTALDDASPLILKIYAEDQDGHTLLINLPGVAILGKGYDFSRQAKIGTQEFKFKLVRDDSGNTITINFA